MKIVLERQPKQVSTATNMAEDLDANSDISGISSLRSDIDEARRSDEEDNDLQKRKFSFC